MSQTPETIELKLHSHWRRHTGHCQITYRSKDRCVYCLQDNGAKYGGVRLMRCSDDGEPSHEVSFKVPVKFERPPNESRLEQDVNAWIDRYESSLLIR